MVSTLKYLPLFILIQTVSLVLTIVGVPLCGALAYGRFWTYDLTRDTYYYPKWAWLWNNQEDGTLPYWYILAHPTWSPARLMFHWSALRNPCNNLRYVRGVSAVGRPLWRTTWKMSGKPYYAQAGWNARGCPVLSAGFDIYSLL